MMDNFYEYNFSLNENIFHKPVSSKMDSSDTFYQHEHLEDCFCLSLRNRRVEKFQIRSVQSKPQSVSNQYGTTCK